MKLKIEKSLYKSYTGSSKLISENDVVTSVIKCPSDMYSKDLTLDLSFDIKFKHFTNFRPFENFVVGIIEKLLKKVIVLDIDSYRNMSLSIISNTTNLGLICNSVLIACLDGGIPMKCIFYSLGNNNLHVYDNEKEIFSCVVDFTEKSNNEKDLKYIKEAVEYGILDMFKFNE